MKKKTKTFKAGSTHASIRKFLEAVLSDRFGDSEKTSEPLQISVEFEPKRKLDVSGVLEAAGLSAASESIAEFIQYRADELKKPIRSDAALARLLKPFGSDSFAVKSAVEESMRNSWQGLFVRDAAKTQVDRSAKTEERGAVAGNGKNEGESRGEKSDEPEAIGAIVQRFKLPEISEEEKARRAANRKRREEERRKAEVSKHLRFLLQDCGERLSPFNRATFARFEVYDDAMDSTLGRIREYLDSIPERFECGDSVFLIGPPGTGKDHLAVAIAREFVIQLNVSARWLDAASFRSRLRSAVTKDGDEKAIVSEFINAGVLILSDPVSPGASLTDFQSDSLFRIVDGRYRAMRPTIVTSNFASEDEASAALGTQVVDRLSHGGFRLRCQWPSFRRRSK